MSEVTVKVEVADLTLAGVCALGKFNVVIADTSGLGAPDKEVSRSVEMTPDQLIATVAVMLHPDGEPAIDAEELQGLEVLFDGWPQNLRPIP